MRGVPNVVSKLPGRWRPSYIPTRATYNKGIYQETIALVAPGSLENIVEHVAAMIREQRSENRGQRAESRIS